MVLQRERSLGSDPGLGKRNLHFPSRKDLVVKAGNGLEAVLHGIKLNQGHVLLVGVAQNLDRLDPPEVTEYFVKHMLFADVLLQRTHVESLRGGVDREGPVRSESACGGKYLSKDLS